MASTHLLIDCRMASASACLDDARMLTVLADAAREAGATVLSQVRYKFGEGSPPGYAVVVLLDESHCTAHSYADSAQIAIDIFTCGDVDPRAILSRVGEQIDLGQIDVKEVRRFPEQDPSRTPTQQSR